MGCRSVGKHFWKEMEKQGIHVAVFFPALFGRLHLRVNYRNHRKIAVIDGKVAYVGGFNIGKEYIGLDPKFGHWRDTHLRICGSAVGGLLLRYIQDWDYAARENLFENPKYFILPEEKSRQCQNADHFQRTGLRTPEYPGQLPAADPQGKKRAFISRRHILYRMNRSRRHF